MNHPFLFSNILIMENAVFLEYVYNYTKSILSLQNFKLNKSGWSKTLNPIPVILEFFFFFLYTYECFYTYTAFKTFYLGNIKTSWLNKSKIFCLRVKVNNPYHVIMLFSCYFCQRQIKSTDLFHELCFRSPV